MAGRPRFKLDYEQLTALAGIQCTDEEIAAVMGCSKRTLQRYKRTKKYQEAFENGKAKGRVSLKRLQFLKAKAGDTTMLIWLDKKYLGGITERIEVDVGKKALLAILRNAAPGDFHELLEKFRAIVAIADGGSGLDGAGGD